jgi:hypothetical protein
MKESFYAEYDNSISTNVKWYRPDINSVIEWYKEWESNFDLSNYKVYLVGALAEGLETNDVDILIMSDDPNLFVLKDMLTSAQTLGFNHSLLIDICWANYKLIQAIRDGLDISDYKSIRNFKTFKKVVNGSEEIFDLTKDKNYKELIPGLYEYEGVSNHLVNKITKRLNDDIYKGIYTELRYVI